MSVDSPVNGKPHGSTPLALSLSLSPSLGAQCDSNGIKRTFPSPRRCATISIARLHADNLGHTREKVAQQRAAI